MEIIGQDKNNIEIKTEEMEEARKFAKEFSMEQFATFAEQMKSLKEIAMLLKDGNVSGVFEKYVSTVDWVSFAAGVYAHSAKHNVSLFESVLISCTAKIFGVSLENVHKVFQGFTELRIEAANIGYFKTTETVEPTDHNEAVMGACKLITEIKGTSNEIDKDLFEASFKFFIDENIPELVSADLNANAGLVGN